MRNIEDYTRVTEVLSIYAGLNFIDPNVLQNACERGTAVHEYCAAVIKGLKPYPIREDGQGFVDSFMSWKEDKPLFMVDRFFCDDLMITGECDALYQDGDCLVLVDFKTSSNQSKTWKLQGSAYSYLAKKIGLNVARIEFVKLLKTGKKAKVYEYDEDFETYKACLKAYRYFFKNKNEENIIEFL